MEESPVQVGEHPIDLRKGQDVAHATNQGQQWPNPHAAEGVAISAERGSTARRREHRQQRSVAGDGAGVCECLALLRYELVAVTLLTQSEA